MRLAFTDPFIDFSAPTEQCLGSNALPIKEIDARRSGSKQIRVPRSFSLVDLDLYCKETRMARIQTEGAAKTRIVSLCEVWKSGRINYRFRSWPPLWLHPRLFAARPVSIEIRHSPRLPLHRDATRRLRQLGYFWFSSAIPDSPTSGMYSRLQTEAFWNWTYIYPYVFRLLHSFLCLVILRVSTTGSFNDSFWPFILSQSSLPTSSVPPRAAANFLTIINM